MHSYGECTIDVDLNDLADRSRQIKVGHAVAEHAVAYGQFDSWSPSLYRQHLYRTPWFDCSCQRRMVLTSAPTIGIA